MRSKLWVLVLVPILAAAVFFLSVIPSSQVSGRTFTKSTELDSLYENWLILRYEILIFLASDRSDGARGRFIRQITAFEREIEYLLDESTFAQVRRLFPEVDAVRARILLDWQETQFKLVEVVYREEGFQAFNQFVLWVTENNGTFEASIDTLRRIISTHGIHRLRWFWTVIYSLSIATVVVVFLLVVFRREYVQAKKAEGKIRRLSRSLITVREHERKRISLDLHDVVVQELSGVCFACTRALDGPSRTETLKGVVREISDSIGRTISAVREIAFDLRSPELDRDFTTSIRHHCQEFSVRHGIEVEFRTTGLRDAAMSYNLKINLFRLIQEALSNVLKHSAASLVSIRLIRSFPYLILRITDDGRGFEAGSVHGQLSKSGMGLHGMEDRVGLLNGQMSIKSGLAQGTRIFIRIPWKENHDGAEEDPDR